MTLNIFNNFYGIYNNFCENPKIILEVTKIIAIMNSGKLYTSEKLIKHDIFIAVKMLTGSPNEEIKTAAFFVLANLFVNYKFIKLETIIKQENIFEAICKTFIITSNDVIPLHRDNRANSISDYSLKILQSCLEIFNIILKSIEAGILTKNSFYFKLFCSVPNIVDYINYYLSFENCDPVLKLSFKILSRLNI